MTPKCTLRSRVAVVCFAVIWLGAFWAAGARAEKTSDERRKRIEAMDPAQKRDLRRRQDWFEALSDAEKEQLRQLHRQIEEHPRAEELREVMRRYCEWVNRLPSHYSGELRGLPPDERIERVKEIRKNTPHLRGRPPWMRGPRLGEWHGSRPSLGDEDRKGVIRWIEDSVDAGAPKLVSALPKAEQKRLLQEMAEAKDQESRLAVFARLCRRRFEQGLEKGPLLDNDALEELQANLSDKTRGRLAEATLDARRLQLIVMLMRVLRSAEPVSREELAKYMKEKLKPEDRKKLTSLPAEEQPRWLRSHYLQSRWPPFPGSPKRPGGLRVPRGGPAKGMQGPRRPPDGPPRPLGVKQPPPNGPEGRRPNGRRKPLPNGRTGPPPNGAKEPRGPGSGSSRRD
jgi:hypothetical protein